MGDRQRYDAVMNASRDSLFRVDKDKKGIVQIDLSL